MTERGCWLLRARDALHRALAYFSVLRPSFIFGFMMVFLPLTAIHEKFPGNSMLANLFVEYGFWKGFWFGFALFGATWALMLTTCLSLDLARDRQARGDTWLPNPPEKERWVTLPMHHKRSFWLFTLTAAPAAIIVIVRTATWTDTLLASVGLTLGCLLAFFLMSLVSSVMYADNDGYRAFPWQPIIFPTPALPGKLQSLFASGMRLMLAPDEIFEQNTDKRRLKDDHFFAALSATGVVAIYAFIYWLFKYHWFGVTFDSIPPAAFIYALLLPLIWTVSALWAYLSRYRLAFLSAVLLTFVSTCLATRHNVESTIGGPSHTYDVVPRNEVFEGRARPKDKPLIIVAASGGGILAAGWTAQVLTQLHTAHETFPQELGLISSVSGGSVGAAHYLSAFDAITQLANPGQRNDTLREVANDAMRSSLAATAYGVAFPDFKRVYFPFFADDTFDRARLLERDWRRIADCRRKVIHASAKTTFEAECKDHHDPAGLLISDKRIAPDLIFNTTVMETGERVAITPMLTLQSKWHGDQLGSNPVPKRHAYARTLSQFLSGSCDPKTFNLGYDIDLWTAARLSATFSYVSPAARAICLDKQNNQRYAAASASTGRQHLIDGGYHDNYGVASALDWLAFKLESGALGDARIALVEIRLSEAEQETEKSQNEWSSAWLGPFWGLLNSWGYSQTSSNDTAVNRLLARFREQSPPRPIQAFVFRPDGKGPLSWHLSETQKGNLKRGWCSKENQQELARFKSFVTGNGTQAKTKEQCLTEQKLPN